MLLFFSSFRYGRKIALFGSYVLLCIASFATGFSPNVYYIIILRTFCGIFYSGITLGVSVLSVEIVGSKYRALSGLIIWQAWSGAVLLLSLQSYYVSNWRDLSKITSIPYIILVFGGL